MEQDAKTEVQRRIMNIKIEFFNIKIQNCNIITHDVNSKMSIKKYKILFLILAVITLHM